MTIHERASQKLGWAEAQLEDCRLCPRMCRVNRVQGEIGWCGASAVPQCFMEFVHFGEEAPLSPSHTIYLTGCNLGCLFCHTAEDRRNRSAFSLTSGQLESLVQRGLRQGARNLNILGGEPIVNMAGLVRILAETRHFPPVVWNTNLYCTEETLDVLADLPDLFLADLKFGNDLCAKKIANAEPYWSIVSAVLRTLYQLDPEKILLRHLVLPGHVDCCTVPILEWIAEELEGVNVSLKTDYLVMPSARRDQDLGRFLAEAERDRVQQLAAELGLRLVEDTPYLRKAPQKESESEGEQPHDIEFVISPHGEVYLHHPTREATELGRALTLNEPKREEIS